MRKDETAIPAGASQNDAQLNACMLYRDASCNIWEQQKVAYSFSTLFSYSSQYKYHKLFIWDILSKEYGKEQ